ncbi:MAG TPA: thiamine pyrophosphate-requiring protein [Steroidobacteraceae bacterium]|nr:thiamine pyrophosphate-requiring protein [Steroidobacteraceae bacterium]
MTGNHQHPFTVGDFIVRRLSDWGVQRIFGYAGDGINGIIGGIQRAGNRPRFIATPHEEIAAFMATAHAKYTGEVGVCLGTSGPGAIHLLNGLYDANLDHQPVVAIVGQQSQMSIGGRYQQEVDLQTLFKDVAGNFVQVATEPTQIRHLIDRAFRIALERRSVTCVIVPNDLQRQEAVGEPPHVHGSIHSSVGWSAPRVVPRDEDLRRAADVLNAGQRVAMLVGAGALGATDAVIEVAETLGAGVAKALLGKAALPDDLPFVTGSAGWLGTRASNAMFAECDTLLIVGSSFPYSEFLPKEGQARGVQIDLDGRNVGLRYPTEVNLVGDSAETLRLLQPLLRPKTERAWRQHVEQLVRDWWAEAERRALHEATPLNPQQVFWELSSRLPDNCMLAGDCGSSTVWYARDLKLRRGMLASLSGTLATMGSGLPYALAAKFAHPDRPAIAIVGDGAMQMNGLNSLLSVARYWSEWQDPRLIVLVLNNGDLNYVSWEQRVLEGDPRFSVSQDVPDFPYARYAELIGLKGIRVDKPGAVSTAWDEALAADRPVVYEAVVDPTVPTLPPDLMPEQREKLVRALGANDAEAPRIRHQLALEGYQLEN